MNNYKKSVFNIIFNVFGSAQLVFNDPDIENYETKWYSTVVRVKITKFKRFSGRTSAKFKIPVSFILFSIFPSQTDFP